ncbi:MAG: mannosyltransferase, partial [Bacteroidales bacterium]
MMKNKNENRSEILFITSYPPRVCGIATYSQDLIKALANKFSNSLSIKVCALESGETEFLYESEVKYILKTSIAHEYEELAFKINKDNCIKMVLIQHEFGFFKMQEQAFQRFLNNLLKPVVIVFHTVLPNPDILLKTKVQNIADACESVIVMTNNSARVLTDNYEVPEQKISVIAHGTHLVPHLSKGYLKRKYRLTGRKVLTTFGLLSSGKNIETTLGALPAVIKTNPEVVFLVIGKTHPDVMKNEGEIYRENLESLV